MSVFEFNENKLWMARLQRTVLWCRPLVSLCFSSSTFWKDKCSCFGGFGSHVVTVFFLFSVYSENSEQGAQRRVRVRVSLNTLTAVQVPETRILDSSWSNMRTRQPVAHHGGYEPLGHG